MRPSVLYIPCATSSHYQTGDIITFSHFEDGHLEENDRYAEEYESIEYSLNDLSTDYD